MRVLMCVKSGVLDDARVRRMATSLSDNGYEVAVVGDRPTTGESLDSVSVVFARDTKSEVGKTARRSPLMRPVRWTLLPNHRRRDDDRYVHASSQVTLPWQPDIIHAHDLSGLRAAQHFITPTTQIIYDTHECWTERSFEGRPDPVGKKHDRSLEQRLGSSAALVITVSDHLASWLAETYGWSNVHVVRNTFPYPEPGDRESSPAALLYAGRIDLERDLLTVVDGAGLSGLSLVVRGSGDAAVSERLRRSGIAVEAPLPISELAAEFRRTGIAVVSLAGDSLNHQVALPNKLFHAVHAGVPVVAADLPQMSELVHTYGIGECYTPGDAGSFAHCVAKVAANYSSYTAQVIDAQHDINWGRDERTLLVLYRVVGQQ